MGYERVQFQPQAYENNILETKIRSTHFAGETVAGVNILQVTAWPLSAIFGHLFVPRATEAWRPLLRTTPQVTPLGLPGWVPKKTQHDEANAKGSGPLTIR